MIHQDSYPVVETFHSLQCEGFHSGTSAFFIRLAGCNVACPWCDTKNSWDEQLHPQRRVSDISIEAARTVDHGASFIVVTGGEPLHHNLNSLCRQLEDIGKPIHLETSGTDKLSGHFNWITLSPKPHRPPNQEILLLCNELKVIVSSPSDLVFAQEMALAADFSNRDLKLYIQPQWGSKKGMELCIDFAMSKPSWKISLQLHKYLGID